MTKLITETKDKSMTLSNLLLQTDSQNNAVLTWEWPKDRQIRIMLLYKWERAETPDVEELIATNCPHDVITRDLASRFTTQIVGERCRFIAVLAHFNDDRTTTMLKPAFVTDWAYKKTFVTATAEYKPLSLSGFRHVTLRVTASDAAQMPLIAQALTYTICEPGKKELQYPLDTAVMSGVCGFFLKKEQSVAFALSKEYEHLLELKRG